MISISVFFADKTKSIATQAPRHTPTHPFTFTYKISFIVDVVRPDEDSQVREAAEACRVEATEVDLYISLIGIFEERMCKK